MEFKILWLYPLEMNLYGDRGNLRILATRLEARGITVMIDELSVGDVNSMDDYDLIYMGGGPDNEQHYIHKDCIERREDFRKAYEQGTFFLLICGGYQMFGQYYRDQNNEEIEGIGLFDYYTVNGQSKRCIGNLILETECQGKPVKLLGFENHGGQTMGVTTPFGKTVFGNGNYFDCEHEGFRQRNVIGTYMHGPLLSKNPELADEIIKIALERKYGDVSLTPLDDSLELEAKNDLIERFLKK